MTNRPSFARVFPSRPRLASIRIVAPIPPAATNPSPTAPAATAGSFPRSLPVTSVTSPRPARSPSTALASCSRSCSMSCRTCSGVRPSGACAIALQRLRRQLRLADRLLGDGRAAALDRAEAEDREPDRAEQERARDDQQREPRRQERRERGGDRREPETEREQQEDDGAERHPDPEPERDHLALDFERRELELE